MKKSVTLLTTLALGALALYAVRAQAEGEQDPPWLPTPEGVAQSDAQAVTNSATPDQRVAAFLGLIRKFESNGDYSVLYGGGHFSDYSEHPNVRVPFTDGNGNANYSTAAGAYQINFPTWNTEIQPALDLPDFSPGSQDQAAVYLLQKIGAYDAAASGDIDTALRLASKRWASLPYSTAQQHPRTLQLAMDTFSDLLGV